MMDDFARLHAAQRGRPRAADDATSAGEDRTSEDAAPAKKRKALKVRQPLGRDRRPITVRPFVVAKFAMRGELTALIAPPGVGKTTLVQQIMDACSRGASWGGFDVPRPLKVMVFHWEDDEAEMDRKVQAIEDRIGPHPHPENLETVYCGAGDDDDDDLILATYNGRTDKFTPTLGYDDVDARIGEGKPDVVVIDPVANTFEGPEGNELLKQMARLLRRLARKHNVAFVLILHTKKYADGMAGNMDAGRNAGTLVGRIRIGLTLFPMTEDEAGTYDIDKTRRHRFVRLDDGKQSYGAKDEARWFEIVETVLPADEGRRTISVGIFEPWEPGGLFEGVENATVHAILAEIDRGVIGEDGQPTGELYQPRQDATHWVGEVIMRRIPGCPSVRAKAILATWKKSRLLVEEEFITVRSRKPRKGLKSVPARWPGAAS